MKTVFFLLLLLLAPAVSFSEMVKPTAYVYAGRGICDLCSDSTMNLLRTAGFEVAPFFSGEITIGFLSQAQLLVIPGGDDLYEARFAFREDELKAIRDYVGNGGKFLGICLGAFLADKLLIEDRMFTGLGLFKGQVHSHDEDQRPRMEKVIWGGRERMIYFQDGPEFHIAHGAKAKVFATYSNNGAVAALQMAYGKGRIGLVGPHPEADERWLRGDRLTDPDGPDYFLLEEFVRELMKEK